ncbi:hypothetical protein EZV62_027342 [Acer yangbiense]|uniref:Reverse transcriptase zinc-binding domain-containing protein n=1 Tax=Acer yangbiense TaxID=1000413 RepID=A0A5C7GTJ0_9ROSI|nr:hypothetical protein EZV62_027342 [Acer yangbiense]
MTDGFLVRFLSRDDSFCWHFTKDGEYTVKSGYKVKVFLWRACNEWIPTLVNLTKRKVPVHGLCPMCTNSFETTIHALWGGCARILEEVFFVWLPPCEGFFKLNTDAAVDPCSNKVGLGMVIRDHKCFVLASGLAHSMIESDAMNVVNMVNSGLEVSSDVEVNLTI